MDGLGLKRLLDPLWLRIQLLVGRFVIEALRETPMLRTVQLSGLADEVLEGVELFQQYGFASSPKDGAEAIGAAISGLRDHTIVIATADRRYKLTLARGEVALHDDLGQRVHLKRAGIDVVTPGDVLVDAEGDVTVEAAGDVLVDGEGSVTVDGATKVDVKSAGAIDVTATAGDINIKTSGANLNVQNQVGDTYIRANGTVYLGGAGGAAGVARIGDQVSPTTHRITGGSTKVKAQ